MCITGQNDNDHRFIYNNKELEVVQNFTYLGLKFTTKGITNDAVKDRLIAAEKAMFGTLVKCKQNFLPIDVCLDMFEKMVLPCMLYGSEIWGFNNLLDLERLQLRYIKYTLKLKKNTPTAMVYGETGILPIEYHVKFRMINFWISIITGKQSKYSYIIYRMCISLHKDGLLECKWINYIKNIINEVGMSFVFNDHLNLEENWLQKVFLPKIKSTLKDQMLQKWVGKLSEENNEETYFYYKEFTTNYCFKNYFKILPADLWIPFCKFRTGNHRLPIEFYSWEKFKKPRNERRCNICNKNDIGDEYHYVMICPVFEEIRDLYLAPYYKIRPSVHKFISLMQCDNKKQLFRLARFIKEILNVIQ